MCQESLSDQGVMTLVLLQCYYFGNALIDYFLVLFCLSCPVVNCVFDLLLSITHHLKLYNKKCSIIAYKRHENLL